MTLSGEEGGCFFSLEERGGDILLLCGFAYVISGKWLTNQKENVCHYVSVLQEKPKKIIA